MGISLDISFYNLCWYEYKANCYDYNRHYNQKSLSMEIKPINPKGNQPWISIGGTDAEAEVPILWPPDAKSWLIGKDPDAGKDWGQEQKGATEDEMVGWHHQLSGHKFEQTVEDSDGQGSLVCFPGVLPWCPRGCRESNTSEQLNNSNRHWICQVNFYLNNSSRDEDWWSSESWLIA